MQIHMPNFLCKQMSILLCVLKQCLLRWKYNLCLNAIRINPIFIFPFFKFQVTMGLFTFTKEKITFQKPCWIVIRFLIGFVIWTMCVHKHCNQILWPNIINFDAVDFSECRPEEVMFLLTLSALIYSPNMFTVLTSTKEITFPAKILRNQCLTRKENQDSASFLDWCIGRDSIFK